MAFSLHDIWVTFPLAAGELNVLHGLTLDLRAQESFAIIGPSGEGKTVLLKIMAGLITPQKGTVKYGGVELGNFSRKDFTMFRRRIGMTFQKSGLFDSLTCSENLRFPLRELSDLSAKEREKKIDQSLEEVGLGGQGDLMVHEMSGGMQKRLGIARSLLLSPEVALYDDPTAGLDPITAGAILDLILEMKRKYEMTIVTVTSDPVQACAIADRVGMLYKGDFVQIGTPDEIRASDKPLVKQFVYGLLDGPLTTARQVVRT